MFGKALLGANGTSGGGTPPPVDLTQGLVAHYLLNNNGDDCYGTYDIAPSGGLDFKGDIAFFDGVDDKLLRTITPPTNITLSYWIKPLQSFTRELISYGVNFSNSTYYGIIASYSKVDGNFYFGNGTSWEAILVGSGTCGIGELKHIAITVDNINKKIHLYENGVLTASNITFTGTINFNVGELSIGYSRWASVNDYISFEMSNVRIYNEAKNQTFIDALYAEGYYPKPLPLPTTDGLVAHYPLTGTAEDVWGAGGNETGTEYNGVAFVDESIFKGDRVAKFDGVNDYISQPTSFRLNSTAFSVSCFIKLSASGVIQHIMSDDNSDTVQERTSQIRVNASNQFEVIVFDSANTPYTATHTQTLTTNVWYFVSVTFDNGTMKLSVNNVVQNFTSTVIALNTTSEGQRQSVIGARWRLSLGYVEFLRGYMSNIRIYNTALTQTDIDTLYAEGTDQTVIPTTTGLIAHYKLNSMSLPYTNYGGVTNINDATRGAVTSFDGVNDYVTGSTLFNSWSEATVSLFIKPTYSVATPYRELVRQEHVSYRFLLSFQMLDTVPVLALGCYHDGVYDELEWTIPDYATFCGSWHHIVASIGNGFRKIIVDGVVVASSAISSPIIGSGGVLSIGADASVPSEYFYGSMSKLKIFNRVLSDAEHTSLYTEVNEPSDAVAYYPLTGAVDEVGTYHGTENGTMVYSGEQSGKELSYFDGVNDFIQLPSLGLTNTNDFTLSFFIKLDTQTITNASIFSLLGSIIVDIRLTTGTTTPKIMVAYQSGSWYSGTHPTVLEIGKVYFVAVRYKYGVGFTTTVDDVDAIKSYTGVTNAFAGANRLGCYGSSGGFYFKGNLSDVRVYKRELLNTEITALYNEVDEPIDGLVAHYPLTSWARAQDMWASYDGVENGVLPYLYDAEFGGTPSFDGVDDYIFVGSGLNAFKTSQHTMCAWVKVNANGVTQRIMNNHNRNGASGSTANSGSNIFLWADGKIGANYDVLNNETVTDSNGNQYTSYGIYTTSSMVLTIGKWYHVAYSVNFNSARLYIDGVLDCTASSTQSIQYGTTDDNYSIGALKYDASVNSYLNGKIKDARHYNRVLSDTEIADIYKYEKNFRPIDIDNGLKAYYPLSNNGLDNNYWQADITSNTSVTFDGQSADFSVADARLDQPTYNYGFGNITNFSLAVWGNIPVTGQNTEGGMVDLTRGSRYINVRISAFPNGKVGGAFFRSNTSWSPSVETPTACNDGLWHHYVFTYNGTSMKMYLDGIEVASVAETLATYGTGVVGLLIGDYGEVGDYDFVGKLAKVRIYNTRAVTPEQVAVIYNTEKGDFGL